MLSKDSHPKKKNQHPSAILGRWQRESGFGKGSVTYKEMNIMEFREDGTGCWIQSDSSGFFTPVEDPFVYHIMGNHLVLSYASQPEQLSIVSFDLCNGRLHLREGNTSHDDEIEVYTQRKRAWGEGG